MVITKYYRHGPLARMEMGQLHVQGLDYAYTLQGWLKGVNGTSLLKPNGTGADMGNDGSATNATRAFDVYGYSLHYFDGDYQSIGSSGWFSGLKDKLQGNYKPLYNGNISSMAVNLAFPADGPAAPDPMLYNYTYDQLNRISGMDAFKGANTGKQLWENGLTATDSWQERITYDANGNIQTYTRNGSSAGGKPLAMDNLTYSYNKDLAGNILNNRLRHVKDAVPAANYTEDIDGQPDDNYLYDAIGNLITDTKENITAIDWSVYGKNTQHNQSRHQSW